MTDQDTLAAAKASLTIAGNHLLATTKRGHRRGLVKEDNLARYLSTFAEHAYSDLAFRIAGSEDGAVALIGAVADAEKAAAASSATAQPVPAVPAG